MAQPEDEFPVTDEHLGPDERDPEAPDADAVEQAMPANPAEVPVRVQRSLEVDEWDAIEQARVVDLDDEYR